MPVPAPLAAARTAPSKHNSQPWRFRIEGAQVVLRLGVGGPVAATPRRALQDLLEPPPEM